MRWFALAFSLAAACCALTVSTGWSQDEEDEEPYVPGLVAEYQQPGRAPIRRLEAVLAARWNERPDERLLAEQPITVTWQGVLLVPDDGPYQLHVHGAGAVQVDLNAKTIVKEARLAGWSSSAAQTLTYGPVPIRVTYAAGEKPTELSLFWSSDRFEREPIAARFLAHDRKQVISTEFERGQVLARALRCEACHLQDYAKQATPMPAPALDQLAGNLNRAWLVDWLTAAAPTHGAADGSESPAIDRRMPYLAIPKEEADALAAWLLKPSDSQTARKPENQSAKRDPKKPAPSRETGEQLLLTRGCLACHRDGELGASGLFGGGDLSAIAAKRPADFFRKWLQNPAALNRDHRMPVFDLTADERESLSLALAARGEGRAASGGENVEHTRARELARKHRCDQCHRLPDADAVQKLPPAKTLAALTVKSHWEASCTNSAKVSASSQPKFDITKPAASALQTYYSQRQATAQNEPQFVTGEQLLIENNCLACHARDPQPAGVLPTKFADKLVHVANKNEDLASQLPAMTPPSLNSVGDKLTDAALAAAITRAGPAHRPYLLVQMPKFRLSKEQTAALSAHFIHEDRIPAYERSKAPEPTPQQLAARALAGKRLVGTDGFSCTACHQVGSVLPTKAPLNARGPTLSNPQERLRKTWFDRFVRNPARIVPRMEMPSVQTPVRGVLNDNLPEQLAAVWHVLSSPGFEPPLPEPVRTLRFYSSEDNSQKQPLVITDLIEHDGQTLDRAALIGLPNRQNILFDFATNRLLAWSQGDLARQRTKGKNWYWEPAGSVLLSPNDDRSELAIQIGDELYEPTTAGQWLAEPTLMKLSQGQAYFVYSLTLQSRDQAAKGGKPIRLLVQQFLEAQPGPIPGLRRRWQITGLPDQASVHLRMVGADWGAKELNSDEERVALSLRPNAILEVRSAGNEIRLRPDAVAVISSKKQSEGKLLFWASYTSGIPQDEYHVPRPPPIPYSQPAVTIAPGLTGERLTLPTDMMPTALAWRPTGDLVVASLKGQVLEFKADSLESSQPNGTLLADGLAAPYGIRAGSDYVDVLAKYGLLRVHGNTISTTEFMTLASGWGYTSDYHDWAVGLPQDAAGNYYLALPCYQDNRVDAAKRLRGSVLKLTPRRPTMSEPGLFGVEVLTHGHRFPMGMALNKVGELFVTDNQGNYNPFNELNHVKPGAHFGFVNKGEKAPESHVAPTVSIPHPWTRSVNGICFLNTPAKLATQGVKSFGPLEGHLVGCEYDTRRLIRMSLQKVNGEYQGCCYPLTVQAPPEEAPLGPICCEVSPTGELFIGSIRDSGWGAGNNIGEVIRVKFDEKQLGHGLAEMRATATGFELDFFQPVQKSLAEDIANYSLSSYRRESTPAYGGNDIDRRTEKLAAVKLSADRKRVTLELPTLRAGHVYELRLKSLAPEGAMFFPAEAHYTLRKIPSAAER